MPVAAIGLGIGLIGSIGQMVAAGKANKQLEALSKTDPKYSQNPVAAQRLGLAQTLLNARQPGASYVERNIYGNQANQEANIERNATSGSQGLAMGAANQGSTNQAFGQLGEQEAEDYQRRYANLSNAEQGVIGEGDKIYQDQARRFGDLVQIRGAQAANNSNSWGSISNLGGQVMNYGLQSQALKIAQQQGGTAKIQAPSAVPLPYKQQQPAGFNPNVNGPINRNSPDITTGPLVDYNGYWQGQWSPSKGYGLQ